MATVDFHPSLENSITGIAIISSRSHAACKIRVKNLKHKSVEDGKIFVIDLAGSENASDTQFHDKSRAKESQAINKSLMALKVGIFLTNCYATTHPILV